MADHTSATGTETGTGATAPLDAVFTCDGSCTIDLPAKGVTAFDFYDAALDIRFNADRTTVEITNFPRIRIGPVTLPTTSPVGGGEEINIDVTMSGGGSGFYDKASGSISIALALFSDVDRDWWFIHEDSKVQLTRILQ
jgi:hypothetical protein